MKRLLLASVLLGLLPVLPAQTVPTNLSFQGRVVDATGKPIGQNSSGLVVPENRKVTFRIYSDASSSYAQSGVWSEVQTVTIAGGDFNVLLGLGEAGKDANGVTEPRTVNFSEAFTLLEAPTLVLPAVYPIPTNRLAPRARFLGITIDDNNVATPDAEISPRQQLVTGAFTFRAAVAATVDKLAIKSDMLDNSAVGATQLAAGAVTAAKLGPDVSHWVASGTNSYRLTGNVGIGTNAPTAPLTVSNNLDAATWSDFFTSSPFKAQTILQDEQQRLYLGAYNKAGQGAAGVIQAASNSGTTDAPNPLLLNPKGGNVGIGTTAPTAALHVVGNAVISGTATIATANITTANIGSITNANFSGLSVGTLGTRTSTLQVGTTPVVKGHFNATGMPLMLVTPTTNGGYVGNPPETALVLGREGIGGETWANFVRFDIGRYPSPMFDGNSNTQLDIRLSKNVLSDDPNKKGGETNDTPTIMSLKADGTAAFAGSIQSPMFKVTEVLPYLAGTTPLSRSATYAANGGTWLVTATCTGYVSNANVVALFKVDNVEIGRVTMYSNNIHINMTRQYIVTGKSAGNYTISLSHNGFADGGDYSQLTILELPF